MKVTLTHIGAVSLGRLLAIWSFVLGIILLLVVAVIMLLATLIGVVASDNPIEVLGGGVIGFILFLVMGVVGLVFNSIFAFIFGLVAATVYNIILGVGGGIDLNFTEKA